MDAATLLDLVARDLATISRVRPDIASVLEDTEVMRNLSRAAALLNAAGGGDERQRYLSRTEMAQRIGVKPDTLGRYNLPEPDAYIGTTRGWLPVTVDEWNEERPGRGGRPRK